MPIATRLTNTGTLLVNGIFDENTSFSLVADALVVGGGGAGGALGGGGAGGHRYLTNQSLVSATNYTVTVGAGGTASTGATGNQGSNSVFDTYTSAGGGGGAGEAALPAAGGSGGGGGGISGTSRPGAAGNTPSTSPSQGNAGGNGNDNGAGTAFAGGGGGGAGGTGDNASGTTTAGNGGLGTPNSITGSSVTRAAGGGGGAYQLYGTGTAGTGGSSIGGNGGRNGLNATSGSPNTGSGGGGNGYTSAGNLQGSSGAGGSGVVILKYPNTFTISNSGGGLTFTTDSSSVAGYNITTFTAGTGQISFTALTKFRTTSNTVFASEFDEVTISGGAVAKREINTGVLQVKNIFDEFTGAPVVDSSLQLWLDAGQTTSYPGSGSTWTDLSGNGNNGTRTNNGGYGGQVTYNSSGYFDFSVNSPASTTGPGDGNGFTMSSMIIPSTGSFTLSAFVRRNLIIKAAGDRETIFSNAGGADGWRFGFGDTGNIYYLIGAPGFPGGYQDGSLGGSTLTDGNWHMMTAVFDRAAQLGSYTIYGYIDGVASGNAAISAGAGGNVAFSTQNPGIGYGGCCDVFAGQIATVSAYNRALTADEITTNFNALRNRYGI